LEKQMDEMAKRTTPGQEAPDPTAPAIAIAGPQTVAAVTPRESPTTAPGVLSDAERRLLTAVLNVIIPAGDGAPGAGEIGVAASIERTLAASAPLRRLFLDGLVAIDVEADRRNADGSSDDFVALDPDAQLSVLRSVEDAYPAFFAALVEHTYRGYYTDPRVYAAIGYDHRPPQPLGHYLPPFDPAILERQRQRTPFWRRTS
jgi:Gluconate 2-dehydrogenase subunit 3